VLLHPGDVTDAELAGHLVALLFAAAGPLTPDDAARLLDISAERLEHVCELLDQEPPLGLALQRGPERLQLTTAPGSTGVVERYLGAPPPVRLSRAALEALAVIAYRGPATRGDIDTIRGVNSDSAVATLLGRNLVTEIGRRESVGRPALLAVTPECLQYLGLRSLEELPPLPTELNGASSSEVPPAEMDAVALSEGNDDVSAEQEDVSTEEEWCEDAAVLALAAVGEAEAS
jgi:segregation and condensation protein B